MALIAVWLGGTAAGLAAGPTVAPQGPLARYAGIHPLNPHLGAFCYIEVAHMHAEWPPDTRVYRVLSNKAQLFVGDPVALGYDGQKYGYFGPHPIVSPEVPASEGVYCYLRGAHYHAQPPQPSPSFVEKGGVHWFMGSFPPDFDRDYNRNDWVNEVRGIKDYQPPKAELATAPEGYRLPNVFDKPAVVVVVPDPAAPPPAAVGGPRQKGRKPSAGLAKQPPNGGAKAAPVAGERAAGRPAP